MRATDLDWANALPDSGTKSSSPSEDGRARAPNEISKIRRSNAIII